MKGKDKVNSERWPGEADAGNYRVGRPICGIPLGQAPFYKRTGPVGMVIPQQLFELCFLCA